MRRLIFAISRLLRRIARGLQKMGRKKTLAPRRVVLLVVATNKYFKLVEPLLESTDRHFLPGDHYEVILFTNLDQTPDCLALVARRNGRARGAIRLKHIEHEAWPMMTLLRYRFFSQVPDLSGYDYIFYSDCDMRFVAEVGDEILGAGLTAVRHCRFYQKKRRDYTYETRPESRACIPPDQGVNYYAGGFQGGTAAAYLAASAECARRIEADLANGIIAIWHDESHWNALLARQPGPLTILDPGYCMAEKTRSEFPSLILALDKDHSAMRAED